MTVRIELPVHCWPRSAEDLETINERLGGQTFYVFGPRVSRDVRGLDGKVCRKVAAESVQFCLEYIAEAPVPFGRTVKEPDDKRVRDFLRGLARKSATAWARAAMKPIRGDREP